MNRCLVLVLLAWVCGVAQAGPGAHGPDGEHLDAPAPQANAAVAPTVEASTETFELVGTLLDDELSVLVDRYATNEPVTEGTLEVEAGDVKATAKLHADLGDFSFTDPALLAALRRPGEHPLVFTLMTGTDSDLIEGRLAVAATGDDHDHMDRTVAGWATLAVAGAAALVMAIRRFRRNRRNHPIPRHPSA